MKYIGYKGRKQSRGRFLMRSPDSESGVFVRVRVQMRAGV